MNVFTVGSPNKCFCGMEWVDFPVKFRWHSGLWQEIFDKHFDHIVEDIERAKAEDRLVVYLSCPISSRNGSYSFTNVEISRHVAKVLEMKWGSRFWILNPALYQMESGEGAGIIKRHAHLLGLEKGTGEKIDLNKLSYECSISGGDYLRMWSRVLVEDGKVNLGGRFDAFYFIGPSDVWNFFTEAGYGHGAARDLTRSIIEYFAGMYATNAEFKNYFGEAEEREDKEKEFFRFYALRAGAHYSLGSRDEYVIWRALNDLRRKEFGKGSEIPAFFDGRQIGFGSSETDFSAGYAIN